MPLNDRGRVLVLAPTGRDATLIVDALGLHGIAPTVCPDLSCISDEIAADAGMAGRVSRPRSPVATRQAYGRRARSPAPGRPTRPSLCGRKRT